MWDIANEAPLQSLHVEHFRSVSAWCNSTAGEVIQWIQESQMEGYQSLLGAHTCTPPQLKRGTITIYFYLIWVLRHFTLTCLQVELPINCLMFNCPSHFTGWCEPRSLCFYPPPTWNIHTAVESERGQVKSRPGAGKAVPRFTWGHLDMTAACHISVYSMCVLFNFLLCRVCFDCNLFRSQTVLETWLEFNRSL